MPNTTSNLGYQLPLGNETADIDVLNSNFTKIDADIVAKLAEAKGYTDDKVQELVNGAPEALDTLKELADKMSDITSRVDNIESTDIKIKDQTNNTQYYLKLDNKGLYLQEV